MIRPFLYTAWLYTTIQSIALWGQALCHAKSFYTIPLGEKGTENYSKMKSERILK